MGNAASRKASSFVELLVAISILSVILAGVMEVFVMSSVLGEISANLSYAMLDVKSKIEEIKGTDFNLITSNYVPGGTPGNTFPLNTATGRGNVVIDATVPDLIKVTVTATVKVRQGRIIGEDINLNGLLDTGEDTDGNGFLSAPVTLTTYIAKRDS